VLEYVTRVSDGGWIDGGVSFVNVPDDAFFIDQEGGAIAEALLLVEDAVVFDDGAFEIAEDRESYSKLLCEFTVGRNTVNTHSENLCLVAFKFGDISLIRLQLLRSTTGERQNVNSKYDVLLAFEIAQLVGLSVGGSELEVRGFVADLQVCFWWSLLGHCRNAQHRKQHKGCK
jgi:hypothetical protein